MPPDNAPAAPCVEFEPYCLALAWLDAHWTRAGSASIEAFQQAFREFETSCKEERDGEDGSESVGGIHFHAMKHGCHDKPTVPYPHYLLRPQGYLTLGRPDVLALTLVDDCDMPQWLLAATARTVEEASLAFGVVPYQFRELHKGLEGHLVSLLDWMEIKQEQAGKENGPLRTRPLTTVIRLKLEGIPMLLDPVTMQAAAYAAICQQIGAVAQALEAMASRDATNAAKNTNPKPMFSPEDVGPDGWKVALLDLQEEEEIGLLISCRNLSVAATILGAIRGLTLRALSACPRAEALLESPLCKELMAKCATAIAPAESRNGSIYDGHLFRWTRTSVALDLSAWEQIAAQVRSNPSDLCEAEKFLSGWVATVSQANTPAGHSEAGRRLAQRSRKQRQSTEVPDFVDWQVCMLGSVDMLVGSMVRSNLGQASDDATSSDAPCLPGPSWLANDALEPVHQAFRELAALCHEMANSETQAPLTRHILGWATTLGVPLPSKLEDAKGKPLVTDLERVKEGHFPFLLGAVKMVVRRPFLQGANNVNYLEHLRERLQYSGLPVTLRRAFMVLFQRYVSLAEHPMRYDSVLDLHDLMHTLWDVLTQHLPAMLKPNKPGDLATTHLVPRLGVSRVRYLAQVALAIENAIDLRSRRRFPESPEHEWDLDFRGQLSQSVMAGETVLRTALGILRRNVLGEYESFRRLAMVNRLSVGATIETHMPGLGTEDKAWLSYIETDVSHLTHLAQLADYFHEVFHLVFAEMVLPNSKASEDLATAPEDFSRASEPPRNVANIRGRLSDLFPSIREDDRSDEREDGASEVFVGMMMMMTVGDGQDDLMWAQHASSYATSPWSAAPAPALTKANEAYELSRFYHNYAQVFAPLGVLSALFDRLRADAKAAGAKDWLAYAVRRYQEGELVAVPSVDDARAVFVRKCKGIARLLPEDFVLQHPEVGPGPTGEWEDKQWCPGVLHRFDQLWVHLMDDDLLSKLWDYAMKVFVCIAADVAKVSTDDALLVPNWREQCRAMDELVEKMFEKATPVSLCQIIGEPDLTPHNWDRPERGSLFVMRALHGAWQRYLPEFAKAKGQTLVLPRRLCWTQGKETPQMQIKWDGEARYADYLVDSIRPDGFCARPEKRQQRLKHQAAFLNTLWGISAIIRRRRLEQLLENSKGGSPDKSGLAVAQ